MNQKQIRAAVEAMLFASGALILISARTGKCHLASS